MLVHDCQYDDSDGREESPHEESYLSPFLGVLCGRSMGWLACEKSVFLLDVVGGRVGRRRPREKRLVACHGDVGSLCADVNWPIET